MDQHRGFYIFTSNGRQRELLLHSAAEDDSDIDEEARVEINAAFSDKQVQKVIMQASLMLEYLMLVDTNFHS